MGTLAKRLLLMLIDLGLPVVPVILPPAPSEAAGGRYREHRHKCRTALLKNDPWVERAPIVERGPLAAGFLVNFWFWDGSGTLQEIEVTSLISLLDVLHV